MEAHRIEKPKRNVLQEVDFKDVDKAVERVLKGAIPTFGTKAAVCQASLLNVDSPTESLSARWYGLGEGFKIKPEWEDYFHRRKLLSRDATPSSLLWEVIDCELKPNHRPPGWLKRYPIETVTSDPPPHLASYYIAHVKAAGDKPINIVCRSGHPQQDVPYESSVIVPIIITPSRGDTGHAPTLCGVCSIDSSCVFEDVISKHESLALICAQVGLLSSLIESLDLAFYDYLLGDEGVLSQAFYYKKIASVKDRRSLGLLFCDLNNFKLVNDGHGHDAGDQIIRRFGASLVSRSKARGLCHQDSWVCRFGGDEFGLLFQCEEDQLEHLKDWALDLILEDIPCLEGCQQHVVSASGGIATWSKITPRSPTGLRVCADRAMYAAKRIYKELQGARTIVSWDTAMPEIEALRTNEGLRSLARHSWSVKKQSPNGKKGHAVPVGAKP